jgi:hypothetical protein
MSQTKTSSSNFPKDISVPCAKCEGINEYDSVWEMAADDICEHCGMEIFDPEQREYLRNPPNSPNDRYA